MGTLRRLLALCLAAGPLALAASAAAQQASAGGARFVGNWQGPLHVSGLSVRLGLTFRADSAGKLSGTLTSIDQGGVKFPIQVTVTGDSVRAGLGDMAYFAGRLTPADSLEGSWNQGGQAMPLTLGRVERISTALRPQEPKRPFPYREEEVTFASVDSGVVLAGTLTLPEGSGPFPAAVLVSGSGAQDRDEAILGHKPFLVLSDYLTRRGIAVLRYDERGIAKSRGNFMTATSEDFAEDAEAAVRLLKARPEIAPGRIGIIGHSEGGLIAPIVAARNPDVGFVVMLAGPGIPGDSLLRLQGRLISASQGVDSATLDLAERAQARMYEVLKAGGDSATISARLREVQDQVMAALTEEQRRDLQLTPEVMEANLRFMQSPWYRFFLTRDPRPDLRRLRVPVLAVNGELDLQVPPRENLEAIAAALREGGNRDFRTVELPKLNHLFQTATTGALAEYAVIEETMSPALLELVAGWINERFGARR